MKYSRCPPCSGSGRVMGGGMMMADCDACDGMGKIPIPEDDITYLMDKQTDRYKKAKIAIKKRLKVDDKEAEELLDNALKGDE